MSTPEEGKSPRKRGVKKQKSNQIVEEDDLEESKNVENPLKGFLFAFTFKYFLKTSAREVIECLIHGKEARLAELMDDSLVKDYCLTECEHYRITPFHSIPFIKCNFSLARQLLLVGINVDEPVKEKTLAWDTKIESGSRLLHLAAHNNHVELIRELIKMGANPNMESDDKSTPLFVACSEGQAEAAEALVQGGANLDFKRPVDHGTLLHAAADCGSEQVAAVLLEHGASVFKINNCGHSPLHVAAKRGYVKLVDLFIKYKADVAQTNKYHLETALHKACQYGQTEAAICLLGHGSDINAANRFGLTPLMKAVERGHGDTTEMLLAKGASVHTSATGRQYNGMSPVHLAVLAKRSDILYMLLEKHAQVDKVDGKQRSPLFLAVQQGLVDAASLLSRYGASVGCVDQEGNTPLHIAASNNNADIVNLLLDRNARISARNINGRTPLHLAVLSDAVETVVLLLANFARADLRDNDGISCYEMATPKMRKVIAKNNLNH